MDDISARILQFLPLVKKLTLSYCSRGDYDDIYASALVGVWKAIESHDPSKSALITWVYNYTRFYCHRALRGKELLQLPKDAVDIGVTSDDQYLADARDEVEWLLESLTERERDILLCSYWEGMTLKQTGMRLGMSETRVFQKRKKLLAGLKGKLEESYGAKSCVVFFQRRHSEISVEKFRTMYENDVPLKVISYELDVPVQTLHNWRRKLKLKSRRSGIPRKCS